MASFRYWWLWLFMIAPGMAQDAYDTHVFFDNSITPDAYYYATGESSDESFLELINGHCPVDSIRFFLPPNSLKLHWRSAPEGFWQLTVRVARWRNRESFFEGDTLSFWAYSESALPAGELPSIFMRDRLKHETPALPLATFTRSLPAGGWTRISIPLAAFAASTDSLDLSRIAAIGFRQGMNDFSDHTVYLDDFRIHGRPGAAGKPAARIAPARPGAVEARAFERHIDLRWQSGSDDTSTFCYLISRSADGKTFKPVGTQRAGVYLYTDWVGTPGKTYWYRVNALDEEYGTSEPSTPVKATTRPFSDEELLSMVQECTFRYFWENAHPVSGLTRENTPGIGNLVTSGASGFGVMTIPVAVERKFITREAGAERMLRIVRFLKGADRFHGIWPHFLDGTTGRVIPLFGMRDNGGDLVETAFMMQGLLAVRSYFDRENVAEKEIRQTITRLWEEAEWDWYRRTPESEFLFWHWSPDQEWIIDHPLVGFNETMIVYLLAISSPTHGVPASLYHTGWAGQNDRAVQYRSGWSMTTEGNHYVNGNSYYGITLDVGCGTGGPLFFTHYSFLGFDPRGKRDKYANYFENNRKLALINRAHCIANPGRFPGYGEDCWGLTASDNPWGYKAHAPDGHNDNGTMTPTGAVSSMPYTPGESKLALEHFYRDLGDRLWGIYGFRDAFNLKENWFANIYMALNEGPIVVMIENYRSGLLWKLFMKNPEIQAGLKKIGFE